MQVGALVAQRERLSKELARALVLSLSEGLVRLLREVVEGIEHGLRPWGSAQKKN
jgi:hypothetical protein